MEWKKETIWLSFSAFMPEVEMTIPIPKGQDEEEYIDELLESVLNVDALYNAEWGFMKETTL